MNKFMLVAKVRLDEQFGISRVKHEKSAAKRALCYVAGATKVALFFLIGILIYKCANAFAAQGYAPALPVIGYMFGSMVGFIYVVLRLNELLSSGTDTEFLFSLPFPNAVQAFMLYFKLYIEATLFAFLVEVPCGLVHVKYVAVDDGFLGRWLVGAFMTVLPFGGIAAMAGIFIALILSGVKNRNLIQSFITLGGIAGVLLLLLHTLFGIGTSMYEINVLPMEEVCQNIIRTVLQNSRFGRFYQMGIVQNLPARMFLFIGVSIIWYVGFMLLVCVGYQEFMLGLDEPATYKKYKLTETGDEPLSRLVFKRQWKQFIHSKSYMQQSLVGVMVAFIISGWFLLHGGNELFALFGLEKMTENMLRVIPMILCFFIGMSCTTFCSLSMDGKTHWIWVTSPIRDSLLYRANIKMNLVLTVPTAILCGGMMAAAFHVSVGTAMVYILLPVAYAIAGACWGMVIERKYADYSPTSEQKLLSNTTSFFLGKLPQMVLPMIASAIFLMI